MSKEGTPYEEKRKILMHALSDESITTHEKLAKAAGIHKSTAYVWMNDVNEAFFKFMENKRKAKHKLMNDVVNAVECFTAMGYSVRKASAFADTTENTYKKYKAHLKGKK